MTAETAGAALLFTAVGLTMLAALAGIVVNLALAVRERDPGQAIGWTFTLVLVLMILVGGTLLIWSAS